VGERDTPAPDLEARRLQEQLVQLREGGLALGPRGPQALEPERRPLVGQVGGHLARHRHRRVCHALLARLHRQSLHRASGRPGGRPDSPGKKSVADVSREDVRGKRLDPLVLVRGLPGHPLHPPLTDATIGMFVLAAGLAIVGAVGGVEEAAAKAMYLALLGGLIVAVPTALTGLVDWLGIEWGTPRWRTATWHLSAMLTAVAAFALAAWRQHPGYQRGDVTTGGLVLTLAGAVLLTFGGWLGGSLVFVHGTRVLDTEREEKTR
jgi:uncharacterized membrane protein